MKVKVKYNLIDDEPGEFSIESSDINVICTIIRALFHETNKMVIAETPKNIAYIQGPTDTIIVSPKE